MIVLFVKRCKVQIYDSTSGSFYRQYEVKLMYVSKKFTLRKDRESKEIVGFIFGDIRFLASICSLFYNTLRRRDNLYSFGVIGGDEIEKRLKDIKTSFFLLDGIFDIINKNLRESYNILTNIIWWKKYKQFKGNLKKDLEEEILSVLQGNIEKHGSNIVL